MRKEESREGILNKAREVRPNQVTPTTTPNSFQMIEKEVLQRVFFSAGRVWHLLLRAQTTDGELDGPLKRTLHPKFLRERSALQWMGLVLSSPPFTKGVSLLRACRFSHFWPSKSLWALVRI